MAPVPMGTNMGIQYSLAEVLIPGCHYILIALRESLYVIPLQTPQGEEPVRDFSTPLQTFRLTP